ncbi:MAG: hypothetical protein NVS2B14_10340 [Chamaesiphon sp.]
MNHKFLMGLPIALLTVLGTASISHAQPKTTVYQGEISGKTQQVTSSSSELPTLEKGYRKHHHQSSSGSGLASWYGAGGGLTAAHRSLPFGTRVRVTNLNNNRSVVVRINDRGPFIGGRVIDVSGAAASELGMIDSGTAPVSLEVLGR